MTIRERRLSDVLKRGYSDEEIQHIYELGRFHLENGNVSRAEPIMLGLTGVAPEFVPAWLALSYIYLIQGNDDSALNAARHAQRLDVNSVEALLFLVTALLGGGDYNTAGAYLGEVQEKIEAGANDNPNVVRYYRAQLARYESRK